MRLNVEVKGKHVLRGVCGDSENCAIAIALKDAGFKSVEVDGETISFFSTVETHLPGGFNDIKTSQRANNFISDFDKLADIEGRAEWEVEYETPKQRVARVNARKIMAAKMDKKPLLVAINLPKGVMKLILKPSAYRRLVQVS